MARAPQTAARSLLPLGDVLRRCLCRTSANAFAVGQTCSFHVADLQRGAIMVTYSDYSAICTPEAYSAVVTALKQMAKTHFLSPSIDFQSTQSAAD